MTDLAIVFPAFIACMLQAVRLTYLELALRRHLYHASTREADPRPAVNQHVL